VGQAVELFVRHGYPMLLLVGFVEYIGLPVASLPVLLIAGALSATGDLGLLRSAGAVVTGGLLADVVWFLIARTHGARVLDRACGLTTNPWACALTVTRQVARVGPPFLLIAKFIPGTANLIAAASGMTRVPFLLFVAFDTAALGLWAGTYLLIGRLFAGQVDVVLRSAVGVSRVVAVFSTALIVLAGVWRVAKIRTHRRIHHQRDAGADRLGGPPDIVTDQGARDGVDAGEPDQRSVA
jgi:membrane protein DedA with SNARE-associated domain